MPLLNTNSHLTTKPYNFDIKCPSNYQSYDRHGYFGAKFRGGPNFFGNSWVFFSTRESTMGLTGWSLSYGTSEFPDCGNLVGADCMRNLRWANMEPPMHFRKTNTDLSVHFRKANTNFLIPVLLPALHLTSKFTPSFISNITINLLHHDECNIISQVTVN